MRFDPDTLAPDRLEALLREIEAEVGDAHDFTLDTRIVEIPVLYDDPWTHETLMRFRDRHQDPDATDLEYAARINGFDDVQGVHRRALAARPGWRRWSGFVAGLPFLYQMVSRERQLEVPKYVRPRTDTPALTVGHGGCFGCIYSVRGAGGYQMFGITPVADLRPAQELPDFKDFVCFFEPGDIVKFEPIDRERYDELRGEVETGEISIRQKPVTFNLEEFHADPDALQRAAAGGAPCRLRSIKPGLSTTVQDRGREGYYHVGVPPSGALDQFSLVAANLLVGNAGGRRRARVRLHGARSCASPSRRWSPPPAPRSSCSVNGEPQPGWTSFAVAAGDVLTFGHLKRGARMYIAVAGGIDVPEVLGSRSTYVLGGLGGYDGRPLQAGDELAIGVSSRRRRGRAPCRRRSGPTCPSELEIRVVMGLYDHLLTDDGRETFLETSWTLTPVADRVGFRYKGAELDMVEREQPFGAGSDPSNIVDAPYPIGSIQVPGGVEPIVLHRDAVSGGGYAMIATVISADMDAVAQSAPGSKTRFVAVDLEAALAARSERADRISRLEGGLANGQRPPADEARPPMHEVETAWPCRTR